MTRTLAGATRLDGDTFVGAASISQEDRLRVELAGALQSIECRQSNTFVAFHIEGCLDRSALIEAFHAVVRRHAALRTAFVPTTRAVGLPASRRFAPEPGATIGFAQSVLPDAHVQVERVDLSTRDRRGRERELARIIAAAVGTRFDYRVPPLMRVVLVARSAYDHVLIVGISTLIADAWSWKVFERDLVSAYRQRAESVDATLPQLSTRFVDYAEWQRRNLTDAVIDGALCYWRDQLGAGPLLELTDLPFAHWPQPGLTGFDVAALGTVMVSRLKAFSRQRRVTPYVVMLTAVVAAIRTSTSRQLVTVVGHTANRDRPGVHNVIGPFANVHLLHIHSGDDSLSSLVDRVAAAVGGAMAHQNVPWELLSPLLGMGRSDPTSVQHPAPFIDFDVFRESVVQWGNGLRVRKQTLGMDRAPIGLRIVARDVGDDIQLNARYAEGVRREGVRHFLIDIVDALEELAESADDSLFQAAAAGQDGSHGRANKSTSGV